MEPAWRIETDLIPLVSGPARASKRTGPPEPRGLRSSWGRRSGRQRPWGPQRPEAAVEATITRSLPPPPGGSGAPCPPQLLLRLGCRRGVPRVMARPRRSRPGAAVAAAIRRLGAYRCCAAERRRGGEAATPGAAVAEVRLACATRQRLRPRRVGPQASPTRKTGDITESPGPRRPMSNLARPALSRKWRKGRISPNNQGLAPRYMCMCVCV